MMLLYSEMLAMLPVQFMQFALARHDVDSGRRFFPLRLWSWCEDLGSR
jgi:hypothetical protein